MNRCRFWRVVFAFLLIAVTSAMVTVAIGADDKAPDRKKVLSTKDAETKADELSRRLGELERKLDGLTKQMEDWGQEIRVIRQRIPEKLGHTKVASGGPTVAQILQFRPRLKNVDYSTPKPEEYAACTVHFVREGKGSGWVLKDGKERLVRRFMDTNGDKQIDIFSYYRGGIEVYREVDSHFSGEPDQFLLLDPAEKQRADPKSRGSGN